MTSRDLASTSSTTDREDEGSGRSDDRQWQRPDEGTAGGPEEEEVSTFEEEEPSGPPPLPLDAVFEILKNQRRRTTLRYLRERGEPVELGDLAEHVAIQENDTSAQSLTSTERKRAYVGLYQCHLPKMDELGAVDFNRDRGIIELGPNVDQLEPYLGGPEEATPWPQYYLALAGGNVALFAGWLVVGTTLGGGLSTVVTATLGAIAVLSFGALALVHHRRWKSEESESTHFDD